MDEPLSDLDAKLRLKMREEICRLQKKMTVLFVTHDQQECFAISDKVLIMKQGHIDQFDIPQTIFHHPRTEYVARFIGYDNFLSVSPNSCQGNYHVKVGETVLTTTEDCLNAKVLTIRPENVVLDSKETTQNTFGDKIINREYLGQSFKYTVESKLGEFKVEEARQKMRSSEDDVTLTLPAKHLHPLSE